MTKHLFAFYVPNFKTCSSKCAVLIQRIIHVMRMKIDDTCIFFNKKSHATIRLTAINKKEIVWNTISTAPNPIYSPSITVLLPLLKKDDLNSAISSLVACGATAIQLIKTEKVQRNWGKQKELERLERIVIAAAEQSKHFAFPTIQEPISLEAALQNARKNSILFCDPTGKPLAQILQLLSQRTHHDITLLVGPEGDLTKEEKEILTQYPVLMTALTPTILRAHLAATLITGIVRSFSPQPL